MKLTPLFLSLLLFVGTATVNAQTTEVIAHRGFWKTDGSAQNSITALLKADSIGCYGSEFDVWLTKDNQLVVNHDATYQSKSMEGSNASELTALTLSNGEHLPTLEAYLKAGKKTKTRLILELKAHQTPERETQAVEAIVKLVKDMKLEKRMEYITFSEHALKEFIRLAPAGTPTFYLKGDRSPEELQSLGATGVDYNLGIFRQKPEWIQSCHDLGLKVNVWTVNKKEDMEWLIEHKVDFVTTNEPLLLESLLPKK